MTEAWPLLFVHVPTQENALQTSYERSIHLLTELRGGEEGGKFSSWLFGRRKTQALQVTSILFRHKRERGMLAYSETKPSQPSIAPSVLSSCSHKQSLPGLTNSRQDGAIPAWPHIAMTGARTAQRSKTQLARPRQSMHKCTSRWGSSP